MAHILQRSVLCLVLFKVLELASVASSDTKGLNQSSTVQLGIRCACGRQLGTGQMKDARSADKWYRSGSGPSFCLVARSRYRCMQLSSSSGLAIPGAHAPQNALNQTPW